MRFRTIALALTVPAFAFSACGDSEDTKSGGDTSSSGGEGGAVTVYSSLPLQGATKLQTNAMVDGAKLALEEAGGKAGNITINYQSLDDSTAQAGNWDPGQTAQNARKAATDDSTVAYIGEFNSGASAVSIPILNQAGIPQISPANTYVGLTTDEPGSEKGEPGKFYPTGQRTYVRIVPRDTIQGLALATVMKEDGCTNVAMANDEETYGAGLSRVIQLKAKEVGLNVTTNDGLEKTASNFRALATKYGDAGVDCFVFAGITANSAAQLFKDVHAAVPNVKLYGPDGTCEQGLTNPKHSGLPTNVGKAFKCTVAVLDLVSYPGGKDFLAAFKAKYNDRPDPYAIYGYEAMSLVIDTIAGLGDKGTDRQAVLEALRATKDRDSVLGTYSFDENGDTTLTDYGLYKVGPDGDPAFDRTIKQDG